MGYSVHRPFAQSTVFPHHLAGRSAGVLTTQTLYDRTGARKYLIARERLAFAMAANAEGGEVATFCLTLAFTGARISEILALTPIRIDVEVGAIIIETLKQRRRGVFRAIPVPRELLSQLEAVHGIQALLADPEYRGTRLWPWCRTTAWQHTKRVMKTAGIDGAFAKPKALRHAFGVEAGQSGIQLNMVQRWMGHARIETTAIYSNALGREERALARRTWQGLREVLKR
jgi:integrase/recombinase XerD